MLLIKWWVLIKPSKISETNRKKFIFQKNLEWCRQTNVKKNNFKINVSINSKFKIIINFKFKIIINFKFKLQTKPGINLRKKGNILVKPYFLKIKINYCNFNFFLIFSKFQFLKSISKIMKFRLGFEPVLICEKHTRIISIKMLTDRNNQKSLKNFIINFLIVPKLTIKSKIYT